ncbi:hypothetical protein CLOP_g23596 [Closterium sp. NIES-67]|nr:hypothetical protein CLOP_g23596 [Closterium sp. NIES-67]
MSARLAEESILRTVRSATIGLRICPRGVAVASELRRGGAAQGEDIVLGAFDVAENALGRLPVLGSVFASADKARQDTDRVGEVGASAHHGVHQGPDQLSVRTGGGTVGGCRRELVADLEGCGDGFGRGHLEAFKDLLEEEAGGSLGRAKTKSTESARELGMPFPRSLLEAVDRAAKFPNGVGREREVPALGTLHEDALMEFTLEKCRGDIHRVQDHAAPADEVQEHADDRGSGGGVNEKTPGGLCNFSNTSFCHAILLRGVREGVSVVNTMGGEIGREMVIEEFTAAIGMEAANGTTESQWVAWPG